MPVLKLAKYWVWRTSSPIPSTKLCRWRHSGTGGSRAV